jgi:hypothetical protein
MVTGSPRSTARAINNNPMTEKAMAIGQISGSDLALAMMVPMAGKEMTATTAKKTFRMFLRH